MNEIKNGDIVFLIHPSNIHTLEINKPYKVYHKYCDLIAIEGDFVDDYDGCDDENVIFFFTKRIHVIIIIMKKDLKKILDLKEI